MEHQYIWWLAVTSTLYLCFSADLTEGRCKGSWAIHACLGGNGKRSPPLEPTLQNSIFFKRLRDFQRYKDELNPAGLTNAGRIPDPNSDVLSTEKKIQEVLFDLALKQWLTNQASGLALRDDAVAEDDW
ncbi:uncharacterized protein LOC135461820 [Liolophura sinensis]|uniref:uncharacterized protein LOC135461820 n=1 Tax=Liolophura sinensis TaxID=3198878 RepID=UPI00315889F4